MQTYRGFSQARSEIPPCVYAIGNFDGVHMGHMALLTKAKEMSRELKVGFGVYTFWPHPQSILSLQRAPSLICNREQKLKILKESGVKYIVEEEFTQEYSQFTAQQFAYDILLKDLDAKGIVTGDNFRFGNKAAGTPQLLDEWLSPRGVACKILSPVSVDGIVCSSSQVRNLVSLGDVKLAQRLLGRPFAVAGRVEKGAGRGKKVGIPTANVGEISSMVPGSGVYATKVSIEGDPKIYSAATNVGTRPTFNGDTQVHVEPHILDFSENVYAKKIEVFFYEKIRDEKKFKSVDELVTQIKRDIEVVRSS